MSEEKISAFDSGKAWFIFWMSILVIVVLWVFAMNLQDAPNAAVAKASVAATSATHTETFGEWQTSMFEKYGCAPDMSSLQQVGGKDETGSLYLVGCGEWIYSVFIDPKGHMTTKRTLRWSGH